MPHIISECSSNKLNALNINWRKALQLQMIARQLLLLEPHLQYDKTVFSAKVGKPKLEQILQSSFPPFNQTASIFCNITYTFYKKDWQTQKDLQGRAQNCTYSQKYVRMHKFLYTCGILRRLKSRGYDLLQGNCNGRGGSSAGE